MKRISFLITALLLVGSTQVLQAQSSEAEVFGEAFEAKKVMDYDKFLKKMSKKEELKNVTVKGKVEAVCKMKGCWMNIVSDNNPDDATFVKFENYGFFVPKDIAGRTVIMKGRGFKEVTSVEELRHMAKDAGKSEAEIQAITEPQKELKFMATGVILLPDA